MLRSREAVHTDARPAVVPVVCRSPGADRGRDRSRSAPASLRKTSACGYVSRKALQPSNSALIKATTIHKVNRISKCLSVRPCACAAACPAAGLRPHSDYLSCGRTLPVPGMTQVTAGCAIMYLRKNCAQLVQSKSAAHGRHFASFDFGEQLALRKRPVDDHRSARFRGDASRRAPLHARQANS